MPACVAKVRARCHGPLRLIPTEMAALSETPILKRFLTFVRQSRHCFQRTGSIAFFAMNREVSFFQAHQAVVTFSEAVRRKMSRLKRNTSSTTLQNLSTLLIYAQPFI